MNVDSHKTELFAVGSVSTVRWASPTSGQGGKLEVPSRPVLGVELDLDRLEEANRLYPQKGLGARDDAAAM
jgi:L-alanine-DL-glutamate epimerase-like enolase superfamily enzyme